MNVLLRDTEEFIDGKETGTLGLVLIRCVFLAVAVEADYLMGVCLRY
jgi:small nuclear ribonucleoprotein (snRNP)-like protein